MTDAVATPSSAYNTLYAEWRLPITLMGGTKAMRAAGTEWLPKEEGETRKAYQQRLDRSFLFNGFRKTVFSLCRRMFARSPQLGEDMPATLKEYAENVDLTGRNLTQFAFDVAKDAMTCGFSHILTDYPKVPAGATLADARAVSARPYWCQIKAVDLIGWRVEHWAGRPVLTQIRWRCDCIVPDGAYGERLARRVKIMNATADASAAVTWELWEQTTDQQQRSVWVKLDEGDIRPLNVIPLATVYFNREAFMCAKPPLQELADLNVEHWQSSSDQRNILHVCRVPFLFGKKLGDGSKKVEIGAHRMLRSSDSDSDIKYVEHSGKGIEAGAADLAAIEERMAIQGVELLVRKAKVERTATESSNDAEGDITELQAMACQLQDALELAFDHMNQFDGGKPDEAGSVTVHKDFGISSRDKAEIEGLIKARQQGDLSRETFLAQLARRGVLEPDFDVEAEMDRIEAEAPKPLEEGDEIDAMSDAELAEAGMTPQEIAAHRDAQASREFAAKQHDDTIKLQRQKPAGNA